MFHGRAGCGYLNIGKGHPILFFDVFRLWRWDLLCWWATHTSLIIVIQLCTLSVFPSLYSFHLILHHAFSVDNRQQSALVLPDRRVSALSFASLYYPSLPSPLFLSKLTPPHDSSFFYSSLFPYEFVPPPPLSLSFSYSCSPWNASLNRFSWNVLFTFFHPLFHLYRQWPFQLFL